MLGYHLGKHRNTHTHTHTHIHIHTYLQTYTHVCIHVKSLISFSLQCTHALFLKECMGKTKWKWKGGQREEHVQRPRSTNRRTSGPWRNLVTRSYIPSIAQKCKCAQSLSCVRLFATPWTVGSFQAKVLELVAISSSRGSYWPRDRTHVSCISCIGKQFLHWQKCKTATSSDSCSLQPSAATFQGLWPPLAQIFCS